MLRKQAIFQRDITPPWPRKVMLELAAVCNHTCVFCAQQAFKRRRAQPSLDFFKSLIQECHQYGSRIISLHGGFEPFASKHLEEVILFCRDVGFETIKVTTNGSLATRKRLEACIDHGLTHIRFSVNGANRASYKAVHGNDHFDRVIHTIRHASQYAQDVGANLHIALNFVEVEANKGEFPVLAEMLRPYVHELTFYEACNQSGQMVEYNIPTKTTSPPCRRPFDRIHITSEGYLSACCGEYGNYLALSDLTQQSLREAFYSQLFLDLRRRHLEDDLSGTLCHRCIYNSDQPIKPLNVELYIRGRENVNNR